MKQFLVKTSQIRLMLKNKICFTADLGRAMFHLRDGLICLSSQVCKIYCPPVRFCPFAPQIAQYKEVSGPLKHWLLNFYKRCL